MGLKEGSSVKSYDNSNDNTSKQRGGQSSSLLCLHVSKRLTHKHTQKTLIIAESPVMRSR